MGSVFSHQLRPLQRLGVVVAICTTGLGSLLCRNFFSIDSKLTAFLHLASAASWAGTQFWVTFVSGVVMINVLPRHMFGLAQSRLFPAYFLTGTTLSSVTLVTYFIQHPYKSWSGDIKTQGVALSVAFLGNAISYIYLEPKTTQQMFENHRYEREQGQGEDGQTSVGTLSNARLENDDVYKKMKHQFFMWHGINASANLVSYMATGFHLWHLSQQMR